MVLLLVLFVAVLIIFFVIEVGKDNRAGAAEVVIAKAWNNRFLRQDVETQKEIYLRKNEKYHEDSEKKVLKKVKEWDKQVAGYQKKESEYLSGHNFTIEDVISLFGYQLLVDFKVNADSEMFRNLVSCCEHAGYLELERGQETGGKKNSFIYAYYLIASMVSYTFVGVLLGIIMSMVMICAGAEMTVVMILGVATFIGMFLIGYLPFDGLQNRAKKRQESIDRDFPNVISQIALLVMAGMNIVKAMEQTAYGDDTVIYLELQKTMKEINQSISVEAALSHLQQRCSNKFLDKMVSVISKSFSAGNANLAENLRTINAECWLEKKHSARRMGETIQNKLFVPTMLMFGGILVVVIVPAISSFNM